MILRLIAHEKQTDKLIIQLMRKVLSSWQRRHRIGGVRYREIRVGKGPNGKIQCTERGMELIAPYKTNWSPPLRNNATEKNVPGTTKSLNVTYN